MSTDPYADLPILDMDEFHASRESEPKLSTALCPHCEISPVNDGFACDYCRGFAHRPASQEIALSTPEDIDSRTGERRLLVDEYRLHADHVDTVRVALSDQIRQCIIYVGDGSAPDRDWWFDEAWAIDRACRALGIED